MSVYQPPETQKEVERENQILEWNGITKEEGKRKPKKRYRFYIYQLELVAAFISSKICSYLSIK
jgi:hypothetical protein